MNELKLKNRKQVFAWSLYDFANQPFTTIIVSFLYSAFFVEVISENKEQGTFLWSVAIAITAIVVSLISPILGALADRGGYRKYFLVISTWICAIFSILLYFPNVGDVYYALSFFIIANIAFEMGSVFCNSYLPDLSSSHNIGKISGYAWGLGFLGGLFALGLSFFLFDIDNPDEIRKINIIVGDWLLLFSIPVFLFVKDRKSAKLNKQHIFSSFQSIKKTFKRISDYKEICRFLIARLFFNDGLITIFALGGVYAVGTLDFTFKEVLFLGVVLNFCAAFGSFFFGYIEDSIGVKKVINISLIVLIVATVIAYIAPYINFIPDVVIDIRRINFYYTLTFPQLMFWIAGILIGLMVGPNQSCSRSLMSRLTPKEKQNEFFGFFALTGKVTSFFGPLLFGIVSKFYSQQLALWVVILLFVIGFILFNRREDKLIKDK